MLVLSRSVNDQIVIGKDIIVTVVDIRGDKVRIGIDAPTDVPVDRQEIRDAIEREGRRARKKEAKPRKCGEGTAAA